MTNTIIDALKWRYATKAFDTNKKVSDSDLDTILEAGRLSPSSFGIQPWKFIVVTDADVRGKLLEHAWNQTQITESSHLIVVAVPKQLKEEHINKFIARLAADRNIPENTLDGYKGMIMGTYNSIKDKPEVAHAWMAKQAYIALGNMLTAAGSLHVDACPMEGFVSPKFDEILGLEAHNLTSVVLMPIGYRDESRDKHASAPKTRFDFADVVIKM